MIIRIKNLRLRTIIGFNDWERKDKQDVIVNIELEADDERMASPDTESEPAVNYRSITKRVIQEVESADFYLLEKLATHLLALVMEFQGVKKATVEVDKPHALRFSDSVSVTCTAARDK
jgi:D-erythro-7,8-dihydroneopterin triphosphate epimerase